jgi:hypothetical protein
MNVQHTALNVVVLSAFNDARKLNCLYLFICDDIYRTHTLDMDKYEEFSHPPTWQLTISNKINRRMLKLR